jgi:carnitine-CoA ligase
LNTALRGTSLRQALDAVGAPFVLAEPHLAARIAEAAPPGLQAYWLAGAMPGDAVSGDAVSAGRSPVWQPAPSPAGYAPRPAAAVRPADTLAILFTSGTTGTPLGVCSPHEQFAWWGINVSRTLRIQSGDVLYTCLPLFHTRTR